MGRFDLDDFSEESLDDLREKIRDHRKEKDRERRNENKRSIRERIRDKILATPQSSLQQVGRSPIWTTTRDPIDPMDCEVWPSSPYCGGDVVEEFDPKNPIDLSPNQIIIEKCMTGVQLGGSMFGIGVPNIQIVFRHNSELCDPEPPPPPIDPIDPPPPGGVRGWNPNWRGEIAVTYNWSSFIIKKYFVEIDGSPLSAREIYIEEGTTSTKTCTGNCLYGITTKIERKARGNYIGWDWGARRPVIEPTKWLPSSQNRFDCVNLRKPSGYPGVWEGGGFNAHNFVPFYTGDAADIKAHFDMLAAKFTEFVPGRGSLYMTSETYYTIYTISDMWQPFNACHPQKPPPPPPPPPKPPRKPRQRTRKRPSPFNIKKKMKCDCCKETERQIKLLRREVGMGRINLPQSLLTLNGKSKGKRKVSSIAELQVRQIQYLDELFGKWEVEIEIQDSNPLKKGDQKKTLRLPNLAAAIGTLMQILIATQQDAAISKNAVCRALIEAAQTKQVSSKTYWAIETIIEYLGFPTEEKSETINYLCSFFKDNEKGKPEVIGTADEFLKESSGKTSRLAYKPSKKEENFQDVLFDLAQGAAITRAAFFVRADEENPANTIKERVKNHDSNLDRLVDTEKSATDFQQELDHIENAFSHLPQRSDPENPWGGDRSSRPRIKDITPGNQQRGDTDGRIDG